MQFIDLAAQQARIKPRIDARIQDVLAHGAYIMGPEVGELEAALSAFCGARHTITCANGTDALLLALRALGVGAGDAVFVPAFTFAATAETIPQLGATPVFVDVLPYSFNMDPDSLLRSIAYCVEQGLKPKAIIPVDLFGLPADFTAISDIAQAHDLYVIDDAAQGFGAQYQDRQIGTLADITTTSFFPAKPLGCYGDGGAIFTDNEDIATLIKSLRVHGKGREKYDNIRIGMNSRLDTIQAAILLEKLAIYPDELKARQSIAERYSAALGNHITTPRVPVGDTSSWAQYTLTAQSGAQRDHLMAALKAADIPSVIYYPIPLHQQTAYQNYPTDPAGLPVSTDLAQRVFSLPMHPYLTPKDQDHIIQTLISHL